MDVRDSDVEGRVLGAFPRDLRRDVEAILRILPESQYTPSSDDIAPVVLRGEALHIPFRVYFPEPAAVSSVGNRERLVMDCLYTRHHDGHVRGRAVRRVLRHSDYWTAPFVVQLLGEYVIEIIHVLESGIEERHRACYATFLAENPEFWRRTEQRVTSYWNCYFRRDFPRRAENPATKLYQKLDAWRAEQAAT